MASRKSHLTRRQFVQTAAAVTAATSAFPRFTWGAANDKPITVGLIGCGGRGTGAANNAMTADPNVKVVALADIVPDRMDKCRKELKEKRGTEIDDKMCFVGMDAYKKLLETDVDYVILATPPYYRPEHLAASIAAGKHVFMEKPVAVDPVGIRKLLAAGEAAKQKSLSVVAGTQRRHSFGYHETIKRIKEGAIGQIVAGRCYWNSGQLWFRKREAGWTESEWMHRDWVNWAWLSGDHIVEQHVHNIDVMNWAIGKHPEKAIAFGSRQRRVTGDQFDNFSTDFTYPGGIHVHSMCRQISGCSDMVAERIIGQVGESDCNGWISNYGMLSFDKNDPYVQEHKDLIDAIRAGKPVNETQNVAESTLSAIMARTAAYTGKEVTWDEIMKSDLELKAPDYELTEENIRAHIPVPGKA
jgi:predicted dehydrogenase